MNKLTTLLTIALIFGLTAFTAVNAQQVSDGDELLVPGKGSNGKDFVMPGDNVSITPKNKFGAPEEEFLKAKKAFGIDTAKEAFPGSDWKTFPGADWSPDGE